MRARALLAAIALILPPIALQLPAPPKSFANDLPFPVTQHTLKNGMRLLIVERHDAPTFSAHIRFKVGSADDPPGLTGMAHLVEHMMFKGTALFGTTDAAREAPLLDRIDSLQVAIEESSPLGHFAQDPVRLQTLKQELAELEAQVQSLAVQNELARTYRRNGATNLNAVTYRDSTQFFVTLPKNRFELWALLESDRFRTPVFRELSTERAVIQEEYRQSIEANPQGLLQATTYTAAFTAVPYRHPIWGWPADLAHITRPLAQAFAHAYYTPNNAFLVLVGDLDPSQVIPVVERYFGGISERSAPTVRHFEEPRQLGQRRAMLHFPAEPQLVMFFQGPPFGHPDTDVLSLLAILLVNGRASRLHRHLVEEQQLATSVASDTSWFLRHASLFSLLATPRPPHNLAEVERAIQIELDALTTELISTEELHRIQNHYEFRAATRSNSNATFAADLARMWDLTGDWRAVFSIRQQMLAITPDRIRDVARRWLRPDRSTIGWLIREAASASLLMPAHASDASPLAPNPLAHEHGDAP
jgi:predicted Zn-dependent peptidase